MVLYIIGLGLGDVEDITVKGLNAVKKCARVYLEHYTSILKSSQAELEAFYGRPLLLADRHQVESLAHQILKGADKEDVALLVVGDPFAATTHSDLVVRAHDRGIPVQVIHNASIMSGVAACGLQLYSFGPTISIPFWTEKWRPDSYYDKLKLNKGHGFHTLCLLDIKVKEQTEENLIKDIPIYEPPRFMTVAQAATQLLQIEDLRKENVVSSDTRAIGIARLGQPDQCIAVGTLGELAAADLGAPLHSLVIPGETHFLEDDMLKFYREQWVAGRAMP